MVERALSRRSFLAAGGVGALVLGAAAAPADASEAPPVGPYRPNPTGRRLAFTPIAPNNVDDVVLADGYSNVILIAWGDPIRPGRPSSTSTPRPRADQARQFGYNNDYLAFFPLPWWSANSFIGLLWSNHEYTNPELMFRDYDADNPTRDQVDIQIQAHGGSIVLIQRAKRGGPFKYRPLSRYNRRITATTPMKLTGAAAGDDLLKTSEDPTGRRVRGMLNNCAGGVTPWGTVLTGEENFHQYFANNAPSPTRRSRPGTSATPCPRAPRTASGSATTTASTWPRSRTSRSASAGWSRSTPTTRTSPRASTPTWAGPSTSAGPRP